MALRLFDYECPKHGYFEEFADDKFCYVACPTCGKMSPKRPSIGRVNVANEDVQHVRESAAVLLDGTSRFSDKPHERALAEKPTRSNLMQYLKAEKLRYAENEGGAPPRYRKPPEPDRKQIVESILAKRQEDRRLEVHS